MKIHSSGQGGGGNRRAPVQTTPLVTRQAAACRRLLPPVYAIIIAGSEFLCRQRHSADRVIPVEASHFALKLTDTGGVGGFDCGSNPPKVPASSG